jgi:hypothetical protein
VHARVHDDAEEATPEQVLIPDGAAVGVPGAFVGMRAQALIDGELRVSNFIEVTLRDPAARGVRDPVAYDEPTAEDEALFGLMRESLSALEEASR